MASDSIPREVEGIFPLELTWVLTPFHKKISFGWEKKPRSTLCTHTFHCTDSADPGIHVLDRWIPATKNTQHAPSTTTECDYLYGWIEKRSRTQNSHPKWVNPWDIVGMAKDEDSYSVNVFGQLVLFRCVVVCRQQYVDVRWFQRQGCYSLSKLSYMFTPPPPPPRPPKPLQQRVWSVCMG